MGGSGGACSAGAPIGAPIGNTARGAVSGESPPDGIGGGGAGFANIPASIARLWANDVMNEFRQFQFDSLFVPGQIVPA